MKQVLGFLVIVACFPLLMKLATEVKSEMVVANDYEQTIEKAIVLPQVENKQPLQMVDRNGQLFNEEYVEWTQPLDLQDVPLVMQQLFILSEDVDFYAHKGFDVSAIARAFIINANDDDIQQGASTITQQLVRMRYLSAEKSYERKLTELFFAYELEQTYSKDEILQMYLNEMYFSNQVYGVGGAATYYFNKPLAQLSLAEMAFLAAIPNNPSLYDPLRKFDNTKSRQERLLENLQSKGVINEEAYTEAINEKITLNLKTKEQQHPAYSTYVLQELRWLLAAQSGLGERIETASTADEKEALQLELNSLYEGLLQQGVIVETALDPNKQEADERAISSILGNGDLQASATVVDNATREIVSIYAGKNYAKFDLQRAYQLPRQPGSSFKPLSVYAPYLELEGAVPSTVVNGANICIGKFCPQNYGGGVYGYTSITTAFKHSYNTTATRLLQRVGLDTSLSYLQKFQFRSLVDEDRSYSLGLGGLTYGVTTLEMADAYTSFIDGYYAPARSIRAVKDLQGNVLYSWDEPTEQIWSAKTVRSMRELLAAVPKSGTGVGLYSRGSSYLGAKTGTTNDYRDYWLAGLNDHYTTAIWIGYDKARSMEQLERAQIHFKIFNTIMN